MRTPAWMSACVPTASWISPRSSARVALLAAGAHRLAGEQRGADAERARRSADDVAKCCSASSSVGAMNAAWQPFSIATSAANSATMVLPLPTSPCTRRCIGCGRARSA